MKCKNLTIPNPNSEGSAENIFIVRDGALVTPPITDNILEGITRKVMIELAREELGLQIIERSIDRTELYVADEALFCGTGVQVVAITKVDHRPVGTGALGPIAKALRDLYFEAVRGKVRDTFDAEAIAQRIAAGTGLEADSWMKLNTQLLVGLR